MVNSVNQGTESGKGCRGRKKGGASLIQPVLFHLKYYKNIITTAKHF